MTSFIALNIEPEEDSEDEIDDSKEIQIEEALKLYQIALKLHSQGPGYFAEAESAYNTLFRSEIFSYFESLSESQRLQIYGDAGDFEPEVDTILTTITAVPTPGIDGAPSTLPQILYLSFKNHGQFLLDRLRYQVVNIEEANGAQSIETSRESQPIFNTVYSSLKLFAEALDRDDTDLELWRQVSRLGSFLGSNRIGRFCLESVLDDDEGSSDAWSEPLGLEGSFATEQLKRLLHVLDDQISECHLPIAPKREAGLINSLKKYMDPCSFLPAQLSDFSGQRVQHITPIPTAKRKEILVPSRSWASCGKAILLQLSKNVQGFEDAGSDLGYTIVLPTQSIPIPEDASMQALRKVVAAPNGKDLVAEPRAAQCLEGRGSVGMDMENVNMRGGGTAKSLPTRTVDVDQNESNRPVSFTPKNIGEELGSHLVGSLETAHKGLGSEGAHISPMELEDNQPCKLPETVRAIGTVSLPTRKRSSEVAGLQEPVDTGRSRSKRIKARILVTEPNNQEPSEEDLSRYYEDQLQECTEADYWNFETAGSFLSKFGVESLGSSTGIKILLSTLRSREGSDGTKSSVMSRDVAVQDLYSILGSWDAAKSSLFLNGAGLEDPVGGAEGGPTSSLAVFLEHSKRGSQKASQLPVLMDDFGLEEFPTQVNEGWTHLDQVAWAWVEHLLYPKHRSPRDPKEQGFLGSIYENYSWPDVLKETFVQMLIQEDEFFHAKMVTCLREVDEEIWSAGKTPATPILTRHGHLADLVQTIFELHLDIYGRITNPSSEVVVDTRNLQLDRLERWAILASDAMSKRPTLESGSDVPDRLAIRFLWSSVVHTSLVELASRDHIILCFEDLKSVIEAAGSPIIELPNNAITPEISVEAAEREISWLTTMDFFLSIFHPGNIDPITIIESLEPILEMSHTHQTALPRRIVPVTEGGDGSILDNESILEDESLESRNDVLQPGSIIDPRMQQMLQFLGKASPQLKLFLWRKLTRAYEAIRYGTRILSCDLRCIELIMKYLRSAAFADSDAEIRQLTIIRWLRMLDDLIARALAIALVQSDAFECVCEDHIRASMDALAALQRLLHAFVLWEDSVRVSQTQPPVQSNATSTTGYLLSRTRLRDMLVRLWTLQYILLKEAVVQTPGKLERPNKYLIDYLRLLHHVLGLRGYCRLSSKVFLRLMKAELVRLEPPEVWEMDMNQIVFDLYGLKICPNFNGLRDHGCPIEALDRHTALEIMDLVLVQANRINIKDLGKSELKSTLEKMQQAIRSPKPTNAMLFNRRIINGYLRSPINPVFLYRALRGIGELSGVLVDNQDSVVAGKGWYFLLGHVALAKFRSQKRVSQGPTDDLDIAIAFFKLDLEFDLEKWETWYRLGQLYDAKLEEDTTWTAEKLNNNMADLIVLQRNAIHCYSMAVAIATRCADSSFETAGKISELYADFGMRIYASTREPFSMEAFNVDAFTKHFNSANAGMYKKRPFKDLRPYAAWKFACVLFRRALVHKSQSWMIPYMAGKCFWKMHNCDNQTRGNEERITYRYALDAFRRAIETLPERRDNRHPEKDPTFEPHYKLVSVVHKLVQTKRLLPEDGCRILSATPYARKAPAVEDPEAWEGYMIQVLKSLRNADKANWHHRMVARAAHTIYDDSSEDPRAALGAKHELTQQIFTKTMTIQVWKPEHERAGRHFVYTSRYVSFFVRLLYQLNDRTTLEALAKRIRKKSGEFFHHTRIWSEVCRTYLELLRRQGSVPEDYQDTVFKSISHEGFLLNAERLGNWALLPETTSPLLDLLRETVELKRLNSNLIKGNPIEDLIGDIYAHLYSVTVPDLIAKSNNEESRVRMRVDHLLMNTDGPAVDTPSPDNRPGDLAPPKQRVKGVGRREIQRKAEALISKPAVPTPSAKSAKTPVLAPEQDFARSSGAMLAVKEDVSKDTVSSVPGSLHDSADDESELSEIEDVAEPEILDPMEMVETTEVAEPLGVKPLFPNLISAKAGSIENVVEEEEKEEEQEDEQEQMPGQPERAD